MCLSWVQVHPLNFYRGWAELKLEHDNQDEYASTVINADAPSQNSRRYYLFNANMRKHIKKYVDNQGGFRYNMDIPKKA